MKYLAVVASQEGTTFMDSVSAPEFTLEEIEALRACDKEQAERIAQ